MFTRLLAPAICFRLRYFYTYTHTHTQLYVLVVSNFPNYTLLFALAVAIEESPRCLEISVTDLAIKSTRLHYTFSNGKRCFFDTTLVCYSTIHMYANRCTRIFIPQILLSITSALLYNFDFQRLRVFATDFPITK